MLAYRHSTWAQALKLSFNLSADCYIPTDTATLPTDLVLVEKEFPEERIL